MYLNFIYHLRDYYQRDTLYEALEEVVKSWKSEEAVVINKKIPQWKKQ